MITFQPPEPAAIDAALAHGVDWKPAYTYVANLAGLFLETRGPRSKPLGTAELVERLYPVAAARGEEGTHARQRMFKALAALARRDLASYASRGAVRVNGFGRGVKPWVWHPPTEPNPEAIKPPTCPHCGEPI